MLQELESEVKFAAAATNFADFNVHRCKIKLIVIFGSLFQVTSADVPLNTPSDMKSEQIVLQAPADQPL